MEADWQHQCSNVKQRDLKLLESTCWADCSFEVGDTKQIFLAHKIYFAKTSAVFATMFYGNMPEPTDKAIKITDIQANIFTLLIRYIYTGEIELKSYQDSGDLIYVAKKYMLEDLLKSCKDYLIKNVSALNALKLYELEKFYEEQELLELALKVIRENTWSVLNSPDFVHIDLTVMEAILEQDILETTEIELFQSLEALAKCQGLLETTERQPSNDNVPPKENKKHLNLSKEDEFLKKIRNVAKKIRYLSMTAREFAKGPGFSKLILSEDAFAILACLNNAEDIEKRYPVGFSKSKRQLVKLSDLHFNYKIQNSNFSLAIKFNANLSPQIANCIRTLLSSSKGTKFNFERADRNWANIILNNTGYTGCKVANNTNNLIRGNVALTYSNGKEVLKICLGGSLYFAQNDTLIGNVISGLESLGSVMNNVCNGCYGLPTFEKA